MTAVETERCCPPLLDGPLDEAEAIELAAVLKALADPARVRLVSMVACSPTGEICACDLPGALDRAQPTVSHHLSQLVKAGILDREQRGNGRGSGSARSGWRRCGSRSARVAPGPIARDPLRRLAPAPDRGQPRGPRSPRTRARRTPARRRWRWCWSTPTPCVTPTIRWRPTWDMARVPGETSRPRREGGGRRRWRRVPAVPPGLGAAARTPPSGRCRVAGSTPARRPVDAALRELDEELGVTLDESAVLGLLDDYPTRSGYVITPVVVWGGGDPTLVPDPAEVLAAYRIGLHELCRDDSPRFVTIPESDRPVVQVPLGRDLIHAPTGAVLVQFRWVALEGRLNEPRRPPRTTRLRLEISVLSADRKRAGRTDSLSAVEQLRRRSQRPVWPKPPPRSVPSSSSTTRHSTSSTRWITSCAMRSPRWIG